MFRNSFDVFLSYLHKEKGNIEQVNLLGGEPSLHPQALSFAKELYQLGVSVGFSTNGFWNESFRKEFEKGDFSFLEFEITYLGKNSYHPKQYEKIKRTFEQLKNLDVSLGLIIMSPNTPYREHLEICEKYGFDLRWALLEPTPKIGLPHHYESLKDLKAMGELVIKMIKEANDKGIYTWADLTVPRCMFSEEQLKYFKNELNDIQFFCPPFFDIDTDLRIWRCLPLAEKDPKKLTDFPSIREAYLYLNNIRESYKHEGVFSECNYCDYLGIECSGGPTIAKKMKK
jgi:hypothetical protein